MWLNFSIPKSYLYAPISYKIVINHTEHTKDAIKCSTSFSMLHLFLELFWLILLCSCTSWCWCFTKHTLTLRHLFLHHYRNAKTKPWVSSSIRSSEASPMGLTNICLAESLRKSVLVLWWWGLDYVRLWFWSIHVPFPWVFSSVWREHSICKPWWLHIHKIHLAGKSQFMRAEDCLGWFFA